MTPYASTTVRAATSEDLSTVAELLAEAFLHADLAGWLIPHLYTRARTYPPYFALLTEHALAHGRVELTGHDTAVSIWYRIDRAPLPEPPDYDQRLADITGEFHHRFAALDQAMHNHHRYDQPHDYLAFLAVHPDHQGRGLGAALLRHHDAELDATGTAAYLEATGPRNRHFYTRQGYRPRPVYRITSDGPPLFPMWRLPPTEATPS